MEEATDGVARCLQCGKRMVPVPSPESNSAYSATSWTR